MSARQLVTFLWGCAAIVLSTLLGPLYDRLHRQSFKENR